MYHLTQPNVPNDTNWTCHDYFNTSECKTTEHSDLGELHTWVCHWRIVYVFIFNRRFFLQQISFEPRREQGPFAYKFAYRVWNPRTKPPLRRVLVPAPCFPRHEPTTRTPPPAGPGTSTPNLQPQCTRHPRNNVRLLSIYHIGTLLIVTEHAFDISNTYSILHLCKVENRGLPWFMFLLIG